MEHLPQTDFDPCLSRKQKGHYAVELLRFFLKLKPHPFYVPVFELHDVFNFHSIFVLLIKSSESKNERINKFNSIIPIYTSGREMFWNVIFYDVVFRPTFANSLIIHEKKTKEIITVKEVWICDPNYHKIRWTFALNFSKRGYINHLIECFIRYSNTSKLVKKTRLRIDLSTHFSMDIWWTLFRVFDMLRQTDHLNLQILRMYN